MLGHLSSGSFRAHPGGHCRLGNRHQWETPACEVHILDEARPHSQLWLGPMPYDPENRGYTSKKRLPLLLKDTLVKPLVPSTFLLRYVLLLGMSGHSRLQFTHALNPCVRPRNTARPALAAPLCPACFSDVLQAECRCEDEPTWRLASSTQRLASGILTATAPSWAVTCPHQHCQPSAVCTLDLHCRKAGLLQLWAGSL